MASADALTRGRQAFDHGNWSEAFSQLNHADAETPLGPDDLDRLGAAAFLTGRDDAAVTARTRAHHAHLEADARVAAARSAFWLVFVLLEHRDQRAVASGWLARAERLLDEHGAPCVERGYLLAASAVQRIGAGDVAGARTAFTEAAALGARFRDAELCALARNGEGRILVGSGRVADGFRILDEVMAGVMCGELAPMVAGVVYCSVISACNEALDLDRARSWTTALSQWCAARPDALTFRLPCLVRRSELFALDGAWGEAMAEAERAATWIGSPRHTADIGAACYQLGELHRLRGEYDAAEQAYRRASQSGHPVQPGLALLRLAQGDVAAATTTIAQRLDVARGGRPRALALRAAVEIRLATGDLPGAREAADALAAQAEAAPGPYLAALATQAAGDVALGDDPRAALPHLHEAWQLWQTLRVPYEVARVRLAIGLAHRRLGDAEGARLEFEAASEGFDRLGAAPDAARVTELLQDDGRPTGGGLTGREVEVLRLVAAGQTNRAIAATLTISEKTVARHLSNIFTKLDLSSRAAATAYAYEHRLI